VCFSEHTLVNYDFLKAFYLEVCILSSIYSSIHLFIHPSIYICIYVYIYMCVWMGVCVSLSTR